MSVQYCKCKLSVNLKRINYKGVQYCGLCYLDQDEIAREIVEKLCKDPRLCSAAKMAIGNEMKRRGAEERREFIQAKKKEYESEELDYYSEGGESQGVEENEKFEREDRPEKVEPENPKSEHFPPLKKNSGRGRGRGRGGYRGK